LQPTTPPPSAVKPEIDEREEPPPCTYVIVAVCRSILIVRLRVENVFTYSCDAPTRITIPCHACLNPVYAMDTYICISTVFTKQAHTNRIPYFVYALRVLNMQGPPCKCTYLGCLCPPHHPSSLLPGRPVVLCRPLRVRVNPTTYQLYVSIQLSLGVCCG